MIVSVLAVLCVGFAARSEAFVIPTRQSPACCSLKSSSVLSIQSTNNHEVNRDDDDSNKNYSGGFRKRGNHDVVEARLWTYVRSVVRARSGDYRQLDVDDDDSSKHYSSSKRTKNPLSTKAAKSLAYFLNENVYQPNDDDGEYAADNPQAIVEPLSRATVQAIRLAADAGDYRLILSLLDGVIHFSSGGGGDSSTTASTTTRIHPIVDPRILGEAVKGLQLAAASLIKIKGAWMKLATHASLSREVGAMELNAMLQALASRGKFQNVVQLCKDNCHVADDYSLSIVLQALKKSVDDDQSPLRPRDVPRALASMGSSCWQWNDAIDVVSTMLLSTNDDPPTNPFNTIVLANLLQLNTRAHQALRTHNGPFMAMQVWNLWKRHNPDSVPDDITATLLVGSLGRNYRAAIHMIHSWRREHGPQGSLCWRAYAGAIATCVRAGRFQESVDLLQLARDDFTMDDGDISKWNGLLLALCGSNQIARKPLSVSVNRETALAVVGSALSLLEAMILSTKPNAESFHAVLLIMKYYGGGLGEAGRRELAGHYGVLDNVGSIHSDDYVHGLLSKMDSLGIEPNFDTYSIAIQCLRVRDTATVLNLLERATTLSTDKKSEELLHVYNSALHTLANAGLIKPVLKVLSDMAEADTPGDTVTFEAVLVALAKANVSPWIPKFLEAKQSTSSNVVTLPGKLGVFEVSSLPALHSSLYSRAISTCLLAEDIRSAKLSLDLMRSGGGTASNSELSDITRVFARSVLSSPSYKVDDVEFSTAQAKAKSAFTLVKGLNNPSMSLTALVAKACAHSQQFDHCETLLRRVHRQAIANYVMNSRRDTFYDPNDTMKTLPSLHRTAIKACASAGNVTAALRFASLIQNTAEQMPAANRGQTPTARGKASGFLEESLQEEIPFLAKDQGIGMGAFEWVSLIVAASKSGHWKACVAALQFLKPYLITLNPAEGASPQDRKWMDSEYRKVSKALSYATECIAVRSQYGWGVRVLRDWMEWTGRRPPVQAVIATVNILSKRGRGEEVKSLLTECIRYPDSGNDLRYKIATFVQSITALHKRGHYELADEVFAEAISNEIIPLSIDRLEGDGCSEVTLDLHGMNLAVAHSAVRVTLQQEILSSSWDRQKGERSDLVIITGRGQKSSLRMRPILRPEIQRMLVEEFYPPLATTSIPGNLGAVRVPSDSIEAWLSHQRAQKGVRMRAVASALKEISTGSRLREALERIQSNSEVA